jgi:hypothetical protein
VFLDIASKLWIYKFVLKPCIFTGLLKTTQHLYQFGCSNKSSTSVVTVLVSWKWIRLSVNGLVQWYRQNLIWQCCKILREELSKYVYKCITNKTEIVSNWFCIKFYVVVCSLPFGSKILKNVNHRGGTCLGALMVATPLDSWFGSFENDQNLP